MILQNQNYFDNAGYTITASSEDYNMPGSHVRNPNARIPVQMNGILAQSIEVDLLVNTALLDIYAGIFPHNLTPSAEVRVQAIANGQTYVTNGINQRLDLYADPRSQTGALYKRVSNLFTGTAGTYRKLRLWINDPDNTDGFIRIGRPLIGDSVSPSRTFSRLWQESIEDTSIKIPLDAGGIRSHVRKSRTVIGVRFLMQDRVSSNWEDLEKLRHLENIHGVDRFFFVSLLDANETYHPVAKSSLSFYARFRKLATEQEDSEGVKSYGFELEEFA